MDYLSVDPGFNSLSLTDLLKARDQFHPHLMHKANVVGTAIGRYLFRRTDPYPDKNGGRPVAKGPKIARTLENSEIRDYSWPCILVFVQKWADADKFGYGRKYDSFDFVPKVIYLEDGRLVPVCVVEAPMVETAPLPLDPAKLNYPGGKLRGGTPVVMTVQGVPHVASLGCLLSDGHTTYVLTSRHVAGPPGTEITVTAGKKKIRLGTVSNKQIGRLPFEKVYDNWPGEHVYLALDAALIEVEDLRNWSASVYGVGVLGPLADLSTINLSLRLVGCPVKAHGGVSGRMAGQISALFYRYKSVAGFEYVADLLIGSRVEGRSLVTQPGDSGTVWVMETEQTGRDLMPIAVQWGGAIFGSGAEQFPFALATNLSNICRELDVEVVRSSMLAQFEYWGAVGHYTIASLACNQVQNKNLKSLMLLNQDRISFKPDAIDTSVNSVTVPGFVPLADVPDKVWKKSKADATPYGRRGPENPNHYADIDLTIANQKSLDQQTPTAKSLDPQLWRNYYTAIGFKTVSERGLLPFRVWQIYSEMVRFASQQDVESFVAAAGILAHYVGDASQPLHGSYLDDGDPFRNPDGSKSDKMLAHGKGYGNGVHSAYEESMLDAKYDKLIPGIQKALVGSQPMAVLKGGRSAGFATIELMRRTRGNVAPIDLVNAYGALVSAGNKAKSDDILWSKFGNGTIANMADCCRTLAMLWDSAWAEGKGDSIPKNKLVAVATSTLQGIYERQDFLPSKALGEIDQYLPPTIAAATA